VVVGGGGWVGGPRNQGHEPNLSQEKGERTLSSEVWNGWGSSKKQIKGATEQDLWGGGAGLSGKSVRPGAGGGMGWAGGGVGQVRTVPCASWGGSG